jgi:hypothetical protein
MSIERVIELMKMERDCVSHGERRRDAALELLAMFNGVSVGETAALLEQATRILYRSANPLSVGSAMEVVKASDAQPPTSWQPLQVTVVVPAVLPQSPPEIQADPSKAHPEMESGCRSGESESCVPVDA